MVRPDRKVSEEYCRSIVPDFTLAGKSDSIWIMVNFTRASQAGIFLDARAVS